MAERHAADVARRGTIAVGPLVSVIMPVWNRDSVVGAAIESVLAQSYRNWELLVVDDGSTDATREVVGRYESDGRIRMFKRPHAGVCAARNHALSEARGQIFAYLDSDNVWYPHYLQEVVRGFDSEPEVGAVHFAQLVRDKTTGSAFIRGEAYDRARMEIDNYIDLNVFAHRRDLFDRLGGFDPALTRGEDWDLILRYSRDRPPVRLPYIGGIYEMSTPGRILTRVAAEPNVYRIRAKLGDRLPEPLTVLYVLPAAALPSAPLLVTEIECLRNWGVEIECWLPRAAEGAPFIGEDVRIHQDSLATTIAKVAPDIIHLHYGAGLAALEGLTGVIAQPVTRHRVDHQSEWGSVSEESSPPSDAGEPLALLPPCPPAFDGSLFYPETNRNREMVLKVATESLQRDSVGTLIKLAVSCPDHRVVLATPSGCVSDVDAELFASMIKEAGDVVEFRLEVTRGEIAALTRQAGILFQKAIPSNELASRVCIVE
ncbi:MAG: glycosyltransferase family A protein, partial [Pseudomonadota bacterium]